MPLAKVFFSKGVCKGGPVAKCSAYSACRGEAFGVRISGEGGVGVTQMTVLVLFVKLSRDTT